MYQEAYIALDEAGFEDKSALNFPKTLIVTSLENQAPRL